MCVCVCIFLMHAAIGLLKWYLQYLFRHPGFLLYNNFFSFWQPVFVLLPSHFRASINNFLNGSLRLSCITTARLSETGAHGLSGSSWLPSFPIDLPSILLECEWALQLDPSSFCLCNNWEAICFLIWRKLAVIKYDSHWIYSSHV